MSDAPVPSCAAVRLRYFRRSFCELDPEAPPPQLSCGALVEARDLKNPDNNPFLYPAWVLAVEGSSLQLLYLADGLTPETVERAGAVAWVPAKYVRPASDRETQRCQPALEYWRRRLWPDEPSTPSSSSSATAARPARPADDDAAAEVAADQEPAEVIDLT